MAVMERAMVIKVKSFVQAVIAWIQLNPIALFLFILAFTMGIAFIMYPHMFDWMDVQCGGEACTTLPITFD
jgi:hypothetical protein